VVPVPLDGTLQRGLHRSGLEAELTLRLRAIHPHRVAGHSDTLERDPRFAAARAGDALIRVSNGHRHAPWQTYPWRALAGYRRQRVENLFERHVAATQEVAGQYFLDYAPGTLDGPGDDVES
jgi:hypothetical protein